MKNLRIVTLALIAAMLFACNTKTQAQVIMKSDSYGFATDTLKTGETIKFSTPANTINAGVEGKYRIHFDYASISGTATFTVIVKSKSNGTSSSYTLHHKNSGTNGVNCDSLVVTGGSPALGWDFNLAPGVISQAGTGYTISNAGRATDLQLVFIAGATQNTRLYNVSVITQK